MELIDILEHLHTRVTANRLLIENGHNRQEVMNSLFDHSFDAYNTHLTRNVKKLAGYFLVEENAPYNEFTQGLQAIMNNVNDMDMIEYTKIEEQSLFDQQHGIKTSGVLWPLEMEEEINLEKWRYMARYVPSPVNALRLLFDHLPGLGIYYKDYTFVDVGSGMGRGLLLASHYPFKAIKGVEIARQLDAIARNNIAVYDHPGQQCRNIQTYNMDILDFDVMEKENRIYYFWEPFTDEIFNAFLLKLLESVQLIDHKIFLVFLGRPYPALGDSDVFKHRDVLITTDKATANDYFLLFIYSN
ncbi:hypothetical protein D3H65_06740 [Paraflavitalea soli]|uniref:DOT1 domain-containing protein n=1 Tax=Paraflavitalea soli TaxID=2315862 RepID=A0A3B7MH29_9BACT|nr:hypothetical protein [Paraflavitalea soli]AXY73692.1 hypothetical protein D3H65_06740 [Paraflavitalea soli]